MNKKVLSVALAVGAVAAPAAMAARPATAPAKPKPVVSLLFKGVVLNNATADMVEVSPVKGTNVFARRALAGATGITVKIAATTRLRSRTVAPDGTKSFSAESFTELQKGDVVYFHIRAARGTALADLPAAKWIRDFTANPAPAAPAA